MVHAYADARRRHSPASLAAAIALSGGMIGALMFSGPTIEAVKKRIGIEARQIPIELPPEPVAPPPRAETPPEQRIARVEPLLPTPPLERAPVLDLSRDPPSFPLGGTIGAVGTDPVIVEPVAPGPPVVTRAEIDPRYAADFQPNYPPAMIRREAEARLIVRVLVGTDGRVKALELRNRVDPAFLEATRRHALARWRFKPATRDGVAIEQWRELAVRFQLDR